MSHPIYPANFEQTINYQHVLLRRKVSRIDETSVTIILCLPVVIARRILLILDILIIFSEYRCLKR